MKGKERERRRGDGDTTETQKDEREGKEEGVVRRLEKATLVSTNRDFAKVCSINAWNAEVF